MARVVQCPHCGSSSLGRIHELRIVAGGGVHPDEPMGKIVALVCEACDERIELDDLVQIGPDEEILTYKR